MLIAITSKITKLFRTVKNIASKSCRNFIFDLENLIDSPMVSI